MIGHVFHSTASGPPEVASSALLAAMFAAALIVVPLTPASRYPRIPHSGGCYAFATCDTHGSRLPGVLCLSTSTSRRVGLMKSSSGQSPEL